METTSISYSNDVFAGMLCRPTGLVFSNNLWFTT